MSTESEHNLLDYNEEKILANLLAIEEHMREEGMNQIECDTWCEKKHYLLTKDHHLDEAISHADSEQRDDFKEFQSELKEWHNNSRDLKSLRELRNRFREMSDDETLEVVCEDGVCHKDIEGTELAKKKNKDDNDNKEDEIDDMLDDIAEVVSTKTV